MITNYLPIPDIHLAPEIVQQLRSSFDARLEELYAQAMRLIEEDREQRTNMVHVPFAFAHYQVEAMYDRELSLFTQLVARPLSDLENPRPSYTISLFLVARP